MPAFVRLISPLLAAVVSLAFAAGCDRGDVVSRVDDVGPAVHVLATVPADGATLVPLDQVVRVQVDRFLAPTSFVRQTVCVESVLGACLAAGTGGATVQPADDPVDRVLVLTVRDPAAPSFDPARSSLAPHTRYTVLIHAPGDAADPGGLRAFDGATLDATYAFSFTTGATPASRQPRRDAPYCHASDDTLCGLPAVACAEPPRAPATTRLPRAIFAGCGASSACHHAPSPGEPASAGPTGAALDLADDAVARAIGHVASETALLPDPAIAQGGGGPFGANMPYVDPGNPANSYLLYKVLLGLTDARLGLQSDDAFTERAAFAFDAWSCAALGDADAGCAPDAGPAHAAGEPVPSAVEPWMPEALLGPVAPGELDRLRRRLHGSGMPWRSTTSLADVRTLSAWIAAGAETACR